MVGQEGEEENGGIGVLVVGHEREGAQWGYRGSWWWDKRERGQTGGIGVLVVGQEGEGESGGIGVLVVGQEREGAQWG